MITTESLIAKFNSVSLEEIDEVKLMNRIDRKYWFHISQLDELLENSVPFYDILEINRQRLMKYQTMYLDTVEDEMYLKHHNRKLNRYKVRRRKYYSTDGVFFEVKFKTNKKRTIKKRIESGFENPEVRNSENQFLIQNAPFEDSLLVPSLNNKFYRLTLIHKGRKDRCTIDIQPKFWNSNGEIQLDDLVIFELKRGQSLKASPMVDLLRHMKIRQRGLSKYCTGRALLDPALKRNAFKPRLRYLENMNEMILK